MRMSDLAALAARRTALGADPAFPDDALALACCDLALSALQQHNYGVGALIIGGNGAILASAGNAVFGEHMDSAGHAEMRVIDAFEQEAPCPPRDTELFVLLEPCPMCTTRALYAGMRAVRWVIPDKDGGMLHRVRHLPPAWRNLAGLQHHSPARVSKAVYALCHSITLSGLGDRRQQWRRHMGL